MLHGPRKGHVGSGGLRAPNAIRTSEHRRDCRSWGESLGSDVGSVPTTTSWCCPNLSCSTREGHCGL